LRQTASLFIVVIPLAPLTASRLGLCASVASKLPYLARRWGGVSLAFS